MQFNIAILRKAVVHFRESGFKEFYVRVLEKLQIQKFLYNGWFRKHAITKIQEENQRKDAESWKKQPVVSIVGFLDNGKVEHAIAMIDAVKRQTYPFWQLCLVYKSDLAEYESMLKIHCEAEERICFLQSCSSGERQKNLNEILQVCSGDWIGILDESVILAPEALYEVLVSAGVNEGEATLLKRRENEKLVDVVYSDEDKLIRNGKKHCEPNFKPDYSMDLLRTNNYIGKFFVVRRELIKNVDGAVEGCGEAWIYNLILCCASKAQSVAHVPRVLFHNQELDIDDEIKELQKQKNNTECKQSIEKHLQLCGLQAEVISTKNQGYFRVKYNVTKKEKISIIIPNKDQLDVLKKCIASIEKSTYTNYEVIIVENNSQKAEIFDYYEKLTGCAYTDKNLLEGTLENGSRICVVTWKEGFNYSAINNFGVIYATGDYLLFLNNDVEVISENWLEELLGHCQREEVAVAGCKLLYPDGTIQHAGVGVGLGGIANSMFVGIQDNDCSYMHRADLQVNYSAVTAACMMVKKTVFHEVGGFEEKLAVAYNDIDLCLKMRKAGYWIVYTPYAKAIHYESKSRGKEDTPEKQQRLKTESDFMIKKWKRILDSGDPFYNSNLSKRRMDYTIDYN